MYSTGQVIMVDGGVQVMNAFESLISGDLKT